MLNFRGKIAFIALQRTMEDGGAWNIGKVGEGGGGIA